jgi:hypothetical protein
MKTNEQMLAIEALPYCPDAVMKADITSYDHSKKNAIRNARRAGTAYTATDGVATKIEIICGEKNIRIRQSRAPMTEHATKIT